MKLVLLVFACLAAYAQSASEPTHPAMVIDMQPGETHLSRLPSTSEGRFGRWLTLDTASVMTRYRFVDSYSGLTTANQLQHQVAVAGDIHLDRARHFSVHAGLYSGSSFLGGWDTTGIGTGSPQSNLYLKQLFLRISPVAGVEIQYGGLGFTRGESSEITSYDADGYVVGERISVRRPKQFWLDEVAVTYGYLGDLNRTSVFHRLGRLNRANYHQFLVAKKLSRNVHASADYSSESGQGTFRQAVSISAKRLRVADVVRFEQYERDEPAGGYGFAAYGEKRLRRMTLGSGYTSHDRRGLYADRFSAGRYVFGNAHYALSPAWSISALMTQALTSPLQSAPRTRIDIAIGYNLRPALGKAGWF